MHPKRQKLNVKKLEANCCHHLQLPIARRPIIVILGLEAHGQTTFHGFTTYWMIKKAPCALCSTKHSKSSKRWCRSVYRADSFIIRNPGATAVPFCRISRTDSSSTRSAGVSTVEGSSWLILMKTSFILMKHPLEFYPGGKPCTFIVQTRAQTVSFNITALNQ